MSETNQMLLWCAARIGAMCVSTVIVARLAGRRNPAAGVWCLQTGVLLVAALTVTAPAQIPSWFSLTEGTAQSETDTVPAQTSMSAGNSP